MGRIEPAESVTDQDAARVFGEIEAAFGMVPNLFRTYASYPPLLRANWEKVKAVMMQGVLERKTKEAIAVVVSKDNSCEYCVRAHTAILASLGVPDEEVTRIERDLDYAGFSERDRALIEFAARANTDPLGITDDDFEAVRRSGAADAEIIEALGVMELYTGFNKFLDSLAVEMDF